MAIRWDSESDWKDNQDSSGTTGRNGNLRQGYSRERPDLSQDLVGYWPLHDDSATDYSGNGNHGSLNGGITTGVAGKAGLQAMSFDGSDDYIGLPNFSAFNEYTVSVWARSSSIGDGREGRVIAFTKNNQFMLVEDQPNTGEWGLQHHDTNQWRQIAASGEKNDWQHICGTWDGSTIRLYIDGEQKASKSATDLDAAGISDAIGKRTGGFDDLYYGGQVADARIYNRALSDSEIQDLYRWGSGDYARPPTGGVSYYKLDGDATDSWNSKDGTANGGLVYSSDSIRGQSGDFDGSDDYINLGSDLAEASDLTVSAWIKLDSIPGSSYTEICTKRRVTALSVNGNNGELHGNLGDGSSWGNEVNGSPLPVGEWIHVAAVYDSGNEIILYRNGVEDTRGTQSLSIGNNSNPRGIGAKYKDGTQWANFINGKIDDLRIYDRKLNPREIFDLYRYGTRGRDMREHLVTH